MNWDQELRTVLTKWGEDSVEFLPKVILAIVILILFHFIAKYLRRYSFRFYSRIFKRRHDVPKLLSIAIYIFFLTSGIFLSLEVLGLESFLAKLVAGAGVAGIIAGFALKDIASNAFAGLLLNIQHPFKEGDWVEVKGHFGTINEMGSITTSIKTVTGQEVYVPNQLIYNDTFTNYSKLGKRRVVLATGVSYGDDLEQVRAAALDEVAKTKGVLTNDVIDFYFTEIGSSTYNFEVRFWIRFSHQRDFLAAKSETIMRIKKRFEEENISIAYSVVTLDFGVKGGVNLYDQPLRIQP